MTRSEAAPKVGDIREINGQIWRCYEIELEGAKWSLIGEMACAEASGTEPHPDPPRGPQVERDKSREDPIISPDQILTQALRTYTSIALVGITNTGEHHVCGSHGAAEINLLLAWGQHFIVSNRVSR